MRVKYRWMWVFISLKMVVFSQNVTDKQQQYRDSLTAKLKADSTRIFRLQKYRPYVNIDQRNSFSKTAPINVNGIQLGVLINDKHAVGFGGYEVTENSKQKVRTKTVNRQVDMTYFTFFYLYTIIDRRFFELDMQVETGAGKYNLKNYNIQTDKLISNRSANLLIEGLGPLFTFKPFRWIGVNAMLGYRFTFEKNPNLNFNGTYYAYGIWLDIRQIIRDYNYYLIKKPRYKKLLEESNCIY